MGRLTRIRIPEAFRDFARLMELDEKHPETLLRYDIPGRTVVFNAAARPGANVIRVRFSEWRPKRRRW